MSERTTNHATARFREPACRGIRRAGGAEGGECESSRTSGCAPWPRRRICAAAPSAKSADASQYAVTKFARDMLGIADNFARALAAVPADVRDAADPQVKAVLDGVEATDRQLLATLERYGVKPIDTSDGKFDPNLHQAIAEVPGERQAGRHASWMWCRPASRSASGCCAPPWSRWREKTCPRQRRQHRYKSLRRGPHVRV